MSQPTVSRYLNGRNVSDSARLSIERAIKSLDYRPNRSARSLKMQRTDVIGVVVGDMRNGFYAEILEHIRATLAAKGYSTLIVPDAGGPAELDRTLGGLFVDGVIVTTSLISPEQQKLILARDLATVSMSGGVGATHDVVAPDNAGGGALIAEHLLSLGHSRFGVIAGPRSARPFQERQRGFAAAAAAAGVPLDPGMIVEAGLDDASAFKAAASLLTRMNPPTAVFTHSDVLAYSTLNAARSLGISVPDEISIASFDDLAPSAWELVQLTTVGQPIAAMAEEAVGLLLRRLKTPDAGPLVRTLPCKLVVRNTTGVPRRLDAA